LQRFRTTLAVFAVLGWAVLAQDSNDLERARRLVQERSTGPAIEAFESWLAAHPDDRSVLREAATFAFRARRWFEAARWLERLVALEPAEPSGWYDLGALRHNQCRFDLAIAAFRQLEALEGSDPKLAARAEHRFLHGESARRLERFAEATE
jgi:Flp pilus assembly protein TadD